MTDLIEPALDAALRDGATLVTVNRRLARAYLTAYHSRRLAQDDKTWLTPKILPLDAWLTALYQDLCAVGLVELLLLTDTQEHLLWQKILNDSGSGSALLSVSATATSLAQSWRIEQSHRRAGDQQDYYLNDDQQQYGLWSAAFQRYCNQHGLIDSARLSDYLLDVLRLDELKQTATTLPARMLLAGFTRLTPQQQLFMDGLHDVGVDIQTDYRPATESLQVNRIACADTNEELLVCARWVREQCLELSAGKSDQAREPRLPESAIGVVVPDLHNRRGEILRAFDAVFFPTATPRDIETLGRPYDISLGKSLDQYAPVAQALLCLELGFNKLSGATISQFLLSPYIGAAELEKTARALVDTRLRAIGIRTASVKHLLSMDGLPSSLVTLLRQMRAAAKRGRALPSTWHARLVGMLDACGWPGDTPPQSDEYQAIEAWQECIDELVTLDDMLGPVGVSDSLALIRQLTDARVFQPQSAEAPVQILGVLEAQGLQFKSLWVMGMDNESWPSAPGPSAYLPLRWQKSMRVPGSSAELNLEMARESVALWSNQAEQTLFSYPLVRDGNEILPSRQIADLESVPIDLLIPSVMPNPAQIVHESLQSQIESVEDFEGPDIDTEAHIGGGARLFEDQANCPFRAFALHRLKIRTLEEPVLGIDARDKGNYLHAAMQCFWTETGDHSGLVALSEEDLSQRVVRAIDTAMRDASHEAPELLGIERDRLARNIITWLINFEIPRDDFSVDEMEEDHEVEFESLKLRFKLDRVDRLTDGGKVIIDYKTGLNNSTTSWHEERITSAQLPLYALVLKDVQAICFAQIVVNETKLTGVASTTNLLPGLVGPDNDNGSWAEQLDSWNDRLAELAAEIRRGYAAVTPTRNACRLCRLPSLCRITTDALLDNTDTAALAARGDPHGS